MKIKADVDPLIIANMKERLNPRPEFSYDKQWQSNRNSELERKMREKSKKRKKK